MNFKFLKLASLILITLIFVALNSFHIFGQNIQNEPFIASSQSSGEETIAILEQIAVKSKESGERLFVIARLGEKEKFQAINLKRLSYTKAFLSMRKFSNQNTVFAQGASTQGEGRIEFYLGSSLKLVTLAKLNKIPNLTCCPDYILPVKINSRSRNSKNQ